MNSLQFRFYRNVVKFQSKISIDRSIFIYMEKVDKNAFYSKEKRLLFIGQLGFSVEFKLSICVRAFI